MNLLSITVLMLRCLNRFTIEIFLNDVILLQIYVSIWYFFKWYNKKIVEIISCIFWYVNYILWGTKAVFLFTKMTQKMTVVSRSILLSRRD